MIKKQLVDNNRDTRFAFSSNWGEISPTKKVIYIYGPLHMHFVKTFTFVKESKHYKTLVEEAKQVLGKTIVKAA